MSIFRFFVYFLMIIWFTYPQLCIRLWITQHNHFKNKNVLLEG